MSAAVAVGSAAVCARARALRSRAASLQRQAASERLRSQELGDRLAENLLQAGLRALGGRGDRFMLRLARTSPMVRLARHDLRKWLAECGVGAETLEEVALACSEACANAVEHPKQAARQLIEIEAHLDEAELELLVRDFGSWNESRRSDVRGRGLSMIAELMDSLEVERHPDRTEIVMRRSTASSASQPSAPG